MNAIPTTTPVPNVSRFIAFVLAALFALSVHRVAPAAAYSMESEDGTVISESGEKSHPGEAKQKEPWLEMEVVPPAEVIVSPKQPKAEATSEEKKPQPKSAAVEKKTPKPPKAQEAPPPPDVQTEALEEKLSVAQPPPPAAPRTSTPRAPIRPHRNIRRGGSIEFRARKVTYNWWDKTVQAEGGVHVDAGCDLWADRVTADLNTGRLWAKGHVSFDCGDRVLGPVKTDALTGDGLYWDYVWKEGVISSGGVRRAIALIAHAELMPPLAAPEEPAFDTGDPAHLMTATQLSVGDSISARRTESRTADGKVVQASLWASDAGDAFDVKRIEPDAVAVQLRESERSAAGASAFGEYSETPRFTAVAEGLTSASRNFSVGQYQTYNDTWHTGVFQAVARYSRQSDSLFAAHQTTHYSDLKWRTNEAGYRYTANRWRDWDVWGQIQGMDWKTGSYGVTQATLDAAFDRFTPHNQLNFLYEPLRTKYGYPSSPARDTKYRTMNLNVTERPRPAALPGRWTLFPKINYSLYSNRSESVSGAPSYSLGQQRFVSFAGRAASPVYPVARNIGLDFTSRYQTSASTYRYSFNNFPPQSTHGTDDLAEGTARLAWTPGGRFAYTLRYDATRHYGQGDHAIRGSVTCGVSGRWGAALSAAWVPEGVRETNNKLMEEKLNFTWRASRSLRLSGGFLFHHPLEHSTLDFLSLEQRFNGGTLAFSVEKTNAIEAIVGNFEYEQPADETIYTYPQPGVVSGSLYEYSLSYRFDY